MAFAVEYKTEQSNGLAVDEEIHSGVSAATKQEYREGDNFENNVQEEKNQSKVCSDDQAKNCSEDFKQQHGIFSLSKGFSLYK